jgi:hypothetical protein
MDEMNHWIPAIVCYGDPEVSGLRCALAVLRRDAPYICNALGSGAPVAVRCFEQDYLYRTR